MSGQAQDKSAVTPLGIVAANVASELARTGLSVTQLAAAAGLTERQIYRLLRGEHEPRVTTVQRVATGLGRDVPWMYTDHKGLEAA